MKISSSVKYLLLLSFYSCLLFSCNNSDDNDDVTLEFYKLLANDTLTYSTINCRYPDNSIYEGFGAITTECGADFNPTGQPIGGGEGYTDLITEATDTVYTTEELITRVGTAIDGEVIYLNPTSVFDLTQKETLEINHSIVLASNGSAIIQENDELIGTPGYTKSNMIEINVDNVRITGIKVEGPHPTAGRDRIRSRGVVVKDASCVEIDNCTFSKWANAGVVFSNSLKGYVHHNFFLKNRGYYLGYGVVLNGESEVLIEANRFNENRHDIAGNGEFGQRYEARYNIIEGNATRFHSFDMHCNFESLHQCNSPNNFGGSIIKIYNNTFYSDNNSPIRFRGIPTIGAWVENNEYPSNNQNDSIMHNNWDINVYSRNNCLID